MASDRKDKIFPIGKTTAIAIYLDDFKKFNMVFWNDKLKKFFIEGKLVKGNEIIYEIRSMRVNEFVDLLDENDIPWRDIKEKYK